MDGDWGLYRVAWVDGALRLELLGTVDTERQARRAMDDFKVMDGTLMGVALVADMQQQKGDKGA